MPRESMTIEEAKKMLGTEFTHIFEEGDSIQGYVKAFDPEIGFTCYSLGFITKEGYDMEPDATEEEEEGGGVCLVGYNFKKNPGDISEALSDLYDIKMTGELNPPKKYPDDKDGLVSCSF